MPKGKAALKSGTETDATDTNQGIVEMKDHIEGDIYSGQESTRELSKESELPNNITDMSVDANTTSNEESDGSLPRKPKRLFPSITGSRNKDAKPPKAPKPPKAAKESAVKPSDNNKNPSVSEVDTQPKQQNTDNQNDKTSPKKKKNICQSYKRRYFDDENAYEDPSLLVNNSTPPALPLPMAEQNSKPKLPAMKPSMEERPMSPISLGKSTESIKAAVKAVREKHPSIMSETSIPRSIFALLVSLLLSLIVFLAVYFLLKSPAVLSVAVAILVFVAIFVTLGFMDGKRMKCLILILLPSVCSRGGRLALYLMLGYFVIKGPLCNMIGNVKTVRTSLKCMKNERPEVIQETIATFDGAQQCINSTSKQLSLIQTNVSVDIGCLQQRCLSVKDKFKPDCQLNDQKTSPTVCNLSQELSCINASLISRNQERCPKEFLEKYCQDEFHEILEFLDEDTMMDDDGCGFLEIFSMLFPLLILFVLYEGYNYDNSYRTHNSFHNFFLTGHFQVIDQSRSSCDQSAVLPLRKVELRKHVRPATVCHLTDVEKKQLWGNLKTYFVVLLIVLFIILADLYMFRMFDLKKDRKERSGNDIVSTNISDIFKSINKTEVNSNRTQNNVTDFKVITTPTPLPINPKQPVKTTELCPANVDSPGSTSKIILPIILSLLLLIILLQAHVSRIQWYVCSRLYKMREKERVFYLYNKVLEDRVQLVEKCREKMKCYHREMKTRNSLEVTRILAQQSGWLSKIFKFCHINLRQCIICGDTEKPEFKICHGLDCSGVYCLTCSFDIDKKCLYCDTELKHSLSLKQADGQDLSSKESLV